MSTSAVSVQLDDAIKARLEALSVATGQPVDEHLRIALLEHLDELEHARSVQDKADAIRRGEILTIPSADLAVELFS